MIRGMFRGRDKSKIKTFKIEALKRINKLISKLIFREIKNKSCWIRLKLSLKRKIFPNKRILNKRLNILPAY